MGNLTRYFDDEEEAYIKSKPDGYLRILVRRDKEGEEWYETWKKENPEKYRVMKEIEAELESEMEEVEEDAPTPMVEVDTMTENAKALEELKKIKGVKVANEALNQNLEKGWACLKCGKRLPFYKSKKCKICGHTMKWS